MSTATRGRGRPFGVRLWLALAVAIAMAASGAVVAGASAADSGAEADFTGRVNDARAAKGLRPLASDDQLVSVARRWSGRMASSGQVSHNPNLSREVTHNWEKLAENVGAGPTVDEIHRAFMESSSHRVNILDGSFTHIGVGVVAGSDGRLFVTQVFMRLGEGGGGGSQAAPATTARPPAPRAAKAPAAAAPAPTTPSAPRLRAAVTSPPAAAPEVAAAPEPPPPPAPSARLVLVLDALHALDGGR